MAAKEIAVKKYVVRLSADERERLETLVRSSRHNGRTFTGARILLKADAGEGGEAWSDSQIAKTRSRPRIGSVVTLRGIDSNIPLTVDGGGH